MRTDSPMAMYMFSPIIHTVHNVDQKAVHLGQRAIREATSEIASQRPRCWANTEHIIVIKAIATMNQATVMVNGVSLTKVLEHFWQAVRLIEFIVLPCSTVTDVGAVEEERGKVKS